MKDVNCSECNIPMIQEAESHHVCPTCNSDLLEIPPFLKKLCLDNESKAPQVEKVEIVVPSLPPLPKRRRDIHTDVRFGAYALVENEQLKKKPFIKRLREKFPEIGSGVICRIVNKLLEQRVIEKDTKFKTKPILVKGRYWRKI
jgi:hypothetical protein